MIVRMIQKGSKSETVCVCVRERETYEVRLVLIIEKEIERTTEE